MPDPKIVEKPYLYPARCFFTGDPNEIPLIDTGVFDTEGGRVYMSFSFFTELLRITGTATPDEVAELRAENERLSAVQARLPEILKEAADGVRDLGARAVTRILSELPDGAVAVPPAPVEAAEGSAGEGAADALAPRESGRPPLRAAKKS